MPPQHLENVFSLISGLTSFFFLSFSSCNFIYCKWQWCFLCFTNLIHSLFNKMGGGQVSPLCFTWHLWGFQWHCDHQPTGILKVTIWDDDSLKQSHYSSWHPSPLSPPPETDINNRGKQKYHTWLNGPHNLNEKFSKCANRMPKLDQILAWPWELCIYRHQQLELQLYLPVGQGGDHSL